MVCVRAGSWSVVHSAVIPCVSVLKFPLHPHTGATVCDLKVVTISRVLSFQAQQRGPLLGCGTQSVVSSSEGALGDGHKVGYRCFRDVPSDDQLQH